MPALTPAKRLGRPSAVGSAAGATTRPSLSSASSSSRPGPGPAPPPDRAYYSSDSPPPLPLPPPYSTAATSSASASHGLREVASASSLSMLARKTSYNQLTQNSLASIPDASAGYGLSPLRGKSPGDVRVGDIVDAPGGMYGIVKFIGEVDGKAGTFVGVELDERLAGKGKNDGKVDGKRYFSTESKRGIFVPVSRTQQRRSTDSSPKTPTIPPNGFSALSPPKQFAAKNRSESPGGRFMPAPMSRPESPMRRNGTPGPPGAKSGLQLPSTPRTASAAGGRFGALSPGPSGPTPSKLSFAPRARAGSMASRDGRAAPRKVSGAIPSNGIGGGFKQPMKTLGNIGGGGTYTPARDGSSLDQRSQSSLSRNTEEESLTSPAGSGIVTGGGIGITKASEPDGGGGEAPSGGDGEMLEADETNDEGANSRARARESDTVMALKVALAEKDRQLKEQSASLLEMESSLTEVQALMETAGSPPASVTSPRSSGYEHMDGDSIQLRALLREKNASLTRLTAEYDSHRADFRSTIDALEQASSETTRVYEDRCAQYEKRIEEHMIEIRELHDRNEDVDLVSRQLKQLEELVAELEEGLEDARRGEAEARAEVEFLRGEVDRTREELRREKEKNAAAVANAAVGKMMGRNPSMDDEVEKKDDEIRGLKAIINSLSGASSSSPAPGGGEELEKERMTRERLQEELDTLTATINSQSSREAELEREIDELRKRREARGRTSSSASERTVTHPPPGAHTSWGSSWRDRASTRHVSKPSVASTTSAGKLSLDTTAPSTPSSSLHPEDKHEPELTPIDSDADSVADGNAVGGGGGGAYCEICEEHGHDILACNNMFGPGAGGPASAGPNGSSTAAEAAASLEVSSVERLHSVSPDMRRSDREEVETNGGGTVIDEDTEDERDLIAEQEKAERERKKKSVHLPQVPSMASLGGDGPVAGKESGMVEMEKWCAMCERDGHDSVDCPLDDF